MSTPDQMAQNLIDLWRLHCDDQDRVFVSCKDPQSGQWQDKPLVFGDELENQLITWFRQRPPERYDLYFCPLPFAGDRRIKTNVKGSKLLWSDMDEVNPQEVPIKPSVHWLSSPGRYQGLWELDQFLDKHQAEEVNKQLTYHIGADKGGWDLTQVLRVPETINHKYRDKPKVGKFSFTNKKYGLGDLGLSDSDNGRSDTSPADVTSDPNKIISMYRDRIPRKVLNLLFAKHADVGKRSDIIWYLEHKLHEIGLSPDEIITLVKHSVWNKYSGRADENIRLHAELTKILESSFEESTPAEGPQVKEEAEPPGLVLESFKDMLVNLRSYPGWLVEGFWMRRSHGIVAGEPKSFKSILSLDLAVSVASGAPFLNQFPVFERGPVLLIQNENSEWIMKDRLEKIIYNKELGGRAKVKNGKLKVRFPADLPLYFINQQGFLLGDPIHQAVVEQMVEKYRPLLIVLDPLYLMFDGDVNHAKDLNPVLNWLLKLKNEYNTGIMLIHHWNKKKGGARGGQRMLGSTTLHGWVESAWYIGVSGSQNDSEGGEGDTDEEITKTEGTPVSLTVEREFRAGGTRPKIDLTLQLQELGDPGYDIKVRKAAKPHHSVTPEMENQLLGLVEMNKSGISERGIARDTGFSRRAIKYIVEKNIENGTLKHTRTGIVVANKNN